MADVEVKSDSGGGKPRSKKLSTRIDLTPMVDLGFLLITFFIFTTTMSSPSTMNLVMPDDTAKKEEQQRSAEEGALTIFIDDDKSVKGKYYFYEGNMDYEGKKIQCLSDPAVQEAYKTKLQLSRAITIRDIILYKKADAEKEGVGMVCVIKPTSDAQYANVVDILDEMTIDEVKVYTLSKLNGLERRRLAEKKKDT